MKPNNDAEPSDTLETPSQANTGTTTNDSRLRGLSGRKVAWSLGVFMFLSLVLIPSGLFLYQGVSDQEKQIQRDWPVVAAKIDDGYLALDHRIEKARSQDEALNAIADDWRAERQNFRSRRLWYEQLQAAQELEGLLASKISKTKGSSLLEFVSTDGLDTKEQAALTGARQIAQAVYREFESAQLRPYRSALKNFPTNTVLLFFRLPEAPVLRTAEEILSQ